jgi:transcription elongation factor Elf1
MPTFDVHRKLKMKKYGNCPHCKKELQSVEFTEIPLKKVILDNSPYRGLTYICPHCRSVLSVQIDPIAVRTEIQNTTAALGKSRNQADQMIHKGISQILFEIEELKKKLPK